MSTDESRLGEIILYTAPDGAAKVEVFSGDSGERAALLPRRISPLLASRFNAVATGS